MKEGFTNGSMIREKGDIMRGLYNRLYNERLYNESMMREVM